MIKTVTKFCPGCAHEAEIVWSIEQDGFKAFCPYRDSPHMPCCESRSSPKEEIERIAASAKEVAEVCADTCESLSALTLVFSKLGESMKREPKQAYLEMVRSKVCGGKK